MNRRTVFASLALVATALGAAAPAHADKVYWSIGISSPGVTTTVSNARPIYHVPPPAVVYPPVVYQAPTVVYPAPAVVYRPAPVVVHPAPVVVYPHPHAHWKEHKHWRRHHREWGWASR
jgi:hypothetical protein